MAGHVWGSGKRNAKGELEQSCRVIQRYLQQQGLSVAHGIVRLDGLYGTASLVSVVQQAELGYILRCRDYRLLKDPAIAQRLESAAVWGCGKRSSNSPQSSKKKLDLAGVLGNSSCPSQPVSLIAKQSMLWAGKLAVLVLRGSGMKRDQELPNPKQF